MSFFDTTRRVGSMMEQSVREVLEHYADRVYSNVRIPTLFTASGTTEIDLLAAIVDVILVVEVKNVQEIRGTPLSSFWEMEGANAGGNYQALNVFTQNRIHIRAVKCRWYEMFKEFPVVLSIIVVPNTCTLDVSLEDVGILRVEELATPLAELRANAEGAKSRKYSLDYLVSKFGSK